ncbi:MAG: NAD(P)-dependent alcohol dehydrogenase [Anaerolineae bacterium]|nr:NAD(P)-dependent alcohol dehydrogenase [Anaerolineae bacterium]
MKAIVLPQYGAPEVLQLREVAQPVPGPQQVLLRVHAAAVNPLDWHRMRAAPFLVRLSDGLWRPTSPHLGADVAGTVVAVGDQVTRFQPGDAVFGEVRGAFAEYVTAAEKYLVPKPPAVTFEAAAAVPVAGLTALQALRDKGQLQPGQAVLINGASGGVGTCAVQLARYFGAEVTAVCSTRNIDLVRSLGAHHVIDYTRDDFTRGSARYDLIVDNVTNHPVAAVRRVLAPRGIIVNAGFWSMPRMLMGVLTGMWLARGQGQQVITLLADPRPADLDFLAQRLAAGELTPFIDRRYPLAQTAEAIRYLETGRARGKVIIQVA